MNLRQIEVFRAVMLTGTISDAAKLLHVSQPAVSQLLQYTEDQLKLTLFQRIKGRLRPTEEAKVLYKEVAKAYEGVLRVKDLADSLVRDRSGTLQVVASPSLGRALMPLALSRFRKARPSVRVAFETLGIRALMEKIMSQQADIGVAVAPDENPDITAVHLCTMKLVCAMPPGHALAALDRVGPADIQRYPLISFGQESAIGKAIDDAFRSVGATREVAINVPFGQTAHALVARNLGVAIIDQFTVMDVPPSEMVVRPFVPETTFEVAALHCASRASTRNVDLFTQIVSEVAREITRPLRQGGSIRPDAEQS